MLLCGIIFIPGRLHLNEERGSYIIAMDIDALFYLDKIRAIAFALPGVTEGSCYGTPGFYASKKLIARLREEGNILVVYTLERDEWMERDVETFYITDHYKNSLYMLVDLDRVLQKDLTNLIMAAWRNRAGKRLVKEWDEEHAREL